MAKVLATVSGIALKPGASRNKRFYSPGAVADAVRKAQGQLAEGSMPLTMRSHHAAEDDSTRIVGRLRSLTLAEDGSARFTADIADTEHGRTIAALLDTTGGTEPFLTGVSIRGAWDGRVRKIKGESGESLEAGDSLTLTGLDYTATPGVPGAQVDTFAWARGGATETTERVLITESVQEAHVTAITEETTPASPQPLSEGVREALLAALPASPHVYADGQCVTCAGVAESAANAKPGAACADPGYRADKRQRFELDTPGHIGEAWSLISKPGNARAYSPAQLKRIKGRIKSAASKAGIQVASEGWTVAPAYQVTEAVAEAMGDPSSAGSYSLTATNGPTTVTVCSYGLDPADLAVILQAACAAASSALRTLDPDMDGDVDPPGADADDDPQDTTGQFDNGDGTADLTRRILRAIRGESAEDPEALLTEARDTWTRSTEVTETSPQEDPATEQAAADQETEAPVTETTTQEAVGAAAPPLSKADVDAAVAAALDAAAAKRKADKKKKAKASESAKPAKAAVTETAKAAEPDIAALVQEGIKTALAEQGLTETTEQKVARLVAEGVTAAKQELVAAGGGPGRKGLVAEHSAARTEDGIPADFPMKDGQVIPSEKWTEGQRRAAGAALQDYVLGSRSVY